MPKTITIPETKYRSLEEKAVRFEMLRRLLELDFFAEPPVKNVKQIIKEFQKTGLYNESFLKSLERGLKESQYFSSSSN